MLHCPDKNCGTCGSYSCPTDCQTGADCGSCPKCGCSCANTHNVQWNGSPTVIQHIDTGSLMSPDGLDPDSDGGGTEFYPVCQLVGQDSGVCSGCQNTFYKLVDMGLHLHGYN